MNVLEKWHKKWRQKWSINCPYLALWVSVSKHHENYGAKSPGFPRLHTRLDAADSSYPKDSAPSVRSFAMASRHLILWFCSWWYFFRSSQGAEPPAQGAFFAIPSPASVRKFCVRKFPCNICTLHLTTVICLLSLLSSIWHNNLVGSCSTQNEKKQRCQRIRCKENSNKLSDATFGRGRGRPKAGEGILSGLTPLPKQSVRDLF